MKVQLITRPDEVVLSQYNNPATNIFDGKWYITLTAIKMIINDTEITIPAGFVTDFKSTSNIFNKPVGGSIVYELCRVVHDYTIKKGVIGITIRESNKLVYEILLLSGVVKYKAYIAYIRISMCHTIRKVFQTEYPIFRAVRSYLKHNIKYGTSLSDIEYEFLQQHEDRSK